MTLPRWEEMGARRRVRNRELFVIDVGPRDDPTPLVLVHGFPTSSYDYAPLIEALGRRRVVTCDLLGYGLSDKPWPHTYSLLEQADFVAQLVKDLAIPRCHLVAHDMGDTVVQELLGRAIEDPRLVPFEIASVTLLNGGVLVDRTRPLLAQKFLDSIPGRAIAPLMPAPLARRLFERGLRRIAGPDRPPPIEELAAQYQLIERDGGRRLLPYLAGYMSERATHRKRWRRALLTHPFPMRLVWGDSDPINPWPVVEEIVRARPATQAIRLHRVGHYPQLEAPGQVAVHVLEFTQQQPS